MEKDFPLQKDDVVQIAAMEGVNPPFWGKLAFVDEVKSWGAQVRVESFEGDAYYRVAWEQMEFVGKPAYVRVDGLAENVEGCIVMPADGHLLQNLIIEETKDERADIERGAAREGADAGALGQDLHGAGAGDQQPGAEGAGEQPPPAQGD